MTQTLDPVPPPVVPEEGWQEFEPWPKIGPGRPFLSEEAIPSRVRVHYFRRVSDQALVGRAWFGPGAQGPPGAAHGGSIAAVLDEAMGSACWRNGHRVVAARLTTEYRSMLPLGTDALLEAWIERLDGRKITVRSRLLGPDGQLFAEAEALFIELTPEQLTAIATRAGITSGAWSGPGA